MKRHNKPYGCTLPSCEKTFGSKNDWKRHESVQHKFRENWRCSVPVNGDACAQNFKEAALLKEHLQVDHIFGPGDGLQDVVESCHIGECNTLRFWCGFCRVLVASKDDAADASKLRFDHIDDHFMGRPELAEPLTMKDWLPVHVHATTWAQTRPSTTGLKAPIPPTSQKRTAEELVQRPAKKLKHRHCEVVNHGIQCVSPDFPPLLAEFER